MQYNVLFNVYGTEKYRFVLFQNASFLPTTLLRRCDSSRVRILGRSRRICGEGTVAFRWIFLAITLASFDGRIISRGRCRCGRFHSSFHEHLVPRRESRIRAVIFGNDNYCHISVSMPILWCISLGWLAVLKAHVWLT